MTRERLLLAEDHVLMAEGLRAILASTYEVVAVVSDGAAVVEAVSRHRPDVLLLDLSLPNRPGMELLRELVPAHPRLKVIIVTMHADPAIMRTALQLGAAGFVPKTASGAELRKAVSEALAGRRYVSPKVPRRGLRGAESVVTVGFDRLTPRQQEITLMIAQGLTSDAIAEALGVSVWTVNYHRKNIRRELGLRSDREMYRYATLVELSKGDVHDVTDV